MSLIEHVRAEIERAEARLVKLRSIEAAVLDLDGAPATIVATPAPAPAPEPAPSGGKRAPAPRAKAATKASTSPPPRSTGPGQRDLSAKAVGVMLKRGRPISPAELEAEMGVSRSVMKRALKPLLAEGKVQATGSTKDRRYVLADHEFHSERREKVETSTVANEKGENAAVLRVKVLDMIRRDPGALNEERLAMALLRDRDTIADACGKLLLDERVVMNPDGTYYVPPARANGRPVVA